MDFFLLGTVLFLLANVAVAVTMLRRVNLNNDSVLAWEQTKVMHPVAAPQVPATQYQPVYMAKAA